MDQFNDIIQLIRTMVDYIMTGRMQCDQVPVEDMLIFIREEYTMMSLDADGAVKVYESMLESCVRRNDLRDMCAVLNSMVMDNAVISALYNERESRTDLGSEAIPYRVETFYYRNLERNQTYRSNSTDHKTVSSFKGRRAVYTAVTGGYDTVRDPVVVDENTDYYLFTDSSDITSDIWKVIYLDNEEQIDTVRLSKYAKIVGCYEYLGDYDYSVWVDGKLQIIGDIAEYIHKYSRGEPILCFNHYSFNDLYKEAANCLMMNRDDPEIINNQINRYRTEGFPENSGLIDGCVLVRDHHNSKLKAAMEDWWTEVKNGSKRDQLSFNYACWKNGVLYDTSPLVSYSNPYFKTYGHK